MVIIEILINGLLVYTAGCTIYLTVKLLDLLRAAFVVRLVYCDTDV